MNQLRFDINMQGLIASIESAQMFAKKILKSATLNQKAVEPIIPVLDTALNIANNMSFLKVEELVEAQDGEVR